MAQLGKAAALSRRSIRRLVKNGGALAVGGLVAQLAFIFVEAYIARRLGQESYGIFSTVYVISLTALFVVDFGMTWKLVQDGSRTPTELPKLLGTTLFLKSVFFFAIYPLLITLLYRLEYDTKAIEFLSVFFFYALLLTVQDSFAAVYIAKQRMAVNALYQGITPICIGALTFFLVGVGYGLNGVAIAYLMGAFVVTFFWAIYTCQTERPRLALCNSWSLLKGSYLYGLTGLLSQIVFKIDVLMLSMLRDMSEVGVYAAGYKLLELTYKIPVLGVRVVSPLLFQKSVDDKAAYRLICRATLRSATVVGLMIGIFVFTLAEPLIIFIFSKDYWNSILILQILSVSIAIKFISSALETILMTSDLLHRRTASLSLATLINIVLNALLIPLYGAVGAAVSTVISDIGLVIFCILFGWNHIEGRCVVKLTLTPCLAALASIAAVHILAINGAIQILLSISVFLVFLVAMRYVKHDEIVYIWQSLQRPKLQKS